MFKKSKATLLLICVFLFASGYFTSQAVLAGATAEPGSSGDPLVTKSYVDKAIYNDNAVYQGGTIIVTRNDDPRDAMAASSITTKEEAVILYTPSNVLHASTKNALINLKPSKVIIAGGPLAITESVASQIKAVVGQNKVTRIYGKTGPDTAVEIAKYVTGKRW